MATRLEAELRAKFAPQPVPPREPRDAAEGAEA
jgi:hypothetical protein